LFLLIIIRDHAECAIHLSLSDIKNTANLPVGPVEVEFAANNVGKG
jgi:hypothetical protein